MIVTNHQSQSHQSQTKNPYVVVVDGNSVNSYQTQLSVDSIASDHCDNAVDSENIVDFLSDSTIEKMRLQVRMQREKVEDER